MIQLLGMGEQATQIFAVAERKAVTMGHDLIGPEHLLVALCEFPESSALRALETFGVDLAALENVVRFLEIKGTSSSNSGPFPTPSLMRLLGRASRQAQRRGTLDVKSDELLIAIACEASKLDANLLGMLGTSASDFRQAILTLLNIDQQNCDDEIVSPNRVTTEHHTVDVPEDAAEQFISIWPPERETGEGD
jgi:ATP-dependent Clp protease ATP-binding subunit ClpA